jgi:hypothetical protein
VIYFLCIFISTSYIINLSIYLCSESFRATFCFTNPDDPPPQLLRISEGVLYFQHSDILWQLKISVCLVVPLFVVGALSNFTELG